MEGKGGYAGGLLVIDLGKGRSSAERYPDEAAERYIGGFGVNNSLFTQFFRPGTEPFSPDNPSLGPCLRAPISNGSVRKSLRLASFSNFEGGSGILVPTIAIRRRSRSRDCRLGR